MLVGLRKTLISFWVTRNIFARRLVTVYCIDLSNSKLTAVHIWWWFRMFPRKTSRSSRRSDSFDRRRRVDSRSRCLWHRRKEHLQVRWLVVACFLLEDDQRSRRIRVSTVGWVASSSFFRWETGSRWCREGRTGLTRWSQRLSGARCSSVEDSLGMIQTVHLVNWKLSDLRLNHSDLLLFSAENLLCEAWHWHYFLLLPRLSLPTMMSSWRSLCWTECKASSRTRTLSRSQKSCRHKRGKQWWKLFCGRLNEDDSDVDAILVPHLTDSIATCWAFHGESTLIV